MLHTKTAGAPSTDQSCAYCQSNKQIQQLTIYALALSRLTGLRLYDFKCAWFNQDGYFEFFPLHVVHKLKR